MLLEWDSSEILVESWAMLVRDTLVWGQVIRSELDFNSLEGKNELLADADEDEDKDKEKIVSVGKGIFDSVEGVSLDAVLNLASNSSSDFYFLFHPELCLINL